MLPVVVHGGGPQIGELMARLGKVTEFRDGFRVTDADTLDIARMVLVGKVNRDIVSAINVHGALAVGLSGEDANLITAPRAPTPSLGFVGDVVGGRPDHAPAPARRGPDPGRRHHRGRRAGQAYNINADTVAGALAEALEAEKLIFLTDVEGLRVVPGRPTSLIHQVSADMSTRWWRRGRPRRHDAQGGGLRPGRARGVRRAHILDGRVPHALLLELFTDAGVGTMVRAVTRRARRMRRRPRPPPSCAPTPSRRSPSCAARARCCSTPTARRTSTSSPAWPSSSLGHAHPVGGRGRGRPRPGP